MCPPTPLEVAACSASIEQLLEKLKLTASERDTLSGITKKQCETMHWFEHRRGRLTASVAKRVFTRVSTLRLNPDAALPACSRV